MSNLGDHTIITDHSQPLLALSFWISDMLLRLQIRALIKIFCAMDKDSYGQISEYFGIPSVEHY